MRVDRPAGDEEGRLEIELVEQLQQFRRADARLVAAIAHGDEPLGMHGVLAGPRALRVDVERQEHRRLVRLRPGIFRRGIRSVGWGERNALECLTVQH